MWNQAVPLSQVDHIKLPRSFFFVIDVKDDVLCAVGLGSSFVGCTIAELRMVNEGFSF